MSENKTNRNKERQKVLRSLIASFKIEGLDISSEKAERILKKVEFKLEKGPSRA
jgi:uncharacterized OsmC-like protein